MAATSDRHAARLMFQSASVLPNRQATITMPGAWAVASRLSLLHSADFGEGRRAVANSAAAFHAVIALPGPP